MDHMLRPDSTVLPESAMIPDRNLIRPPPNQFTHQVIAKQPYFYATPNENTAADGVFEPGTAVVLMLYIGCKYCHVVDGRGLYVVTLFDALKPT